jgi:hypothetical protein
VRDQGSNRPAALKRKTLGGNINNYAVPVPV